MSDAATGTPSGPARAWAILRDNPPVAALMGALAILLIGHLVSPAFAAPTQIVRQLTVAAILAFVAAGQTLVVLSGREGIDHSVGSVMSLAALVSGDVMGGADANVPLALLAALGVGALAGGQGTYWGTIAGAVFLTFLTALLTTFALDAAARQIVFGLTLVGFMVAYGRERALRA